MNCNEVRRENSQLTTKDEGIVKGAAIDILDAVKNVS